MIIHLKSVELVSHGGRNLQDGFGIITHGGVNHESDPFGGTGAV